MSTVRWLSFWALSTACACGAASSKSNFDGGGAAGAGAGAASAGGGAAGASQGGASAGGDAGAAGASQGGASAGGDAGASSQGGANVGGQAGASAGGDAGASAAGAAGTGGAAGDPFGSAGAGASAAGAAGTTTGGAGKGGACAGVTSKTTPKTLPVDVIFVIDNSGSMNDEIDFIQSKMNAFSSAIGTSGIDIHVVMVSALKGCLFGPLQGCNPLFLQGFCLPAPFGSGSCPADANPPAYTHPNTYVNSNDGMNVVMKSWPQWKDALRMGAKKTMVVVTDDDVTVAPYAADGFPNGEVGGAAKFIADFTALDPALLKDWKMAGIYAFTKCASAAAEGKVWREAVNQTGGLHGDLCKQDLQPILDDLQKAVVVGTQIACQWKLPPPPPGLALDPNQVNVVYTDGGGADHEVLYAKGPATCSPAGGGWYFDDEVNPTTVLACPSTCATIQADPKASVAVTFGCERKGVKN
ncbi:MAG: hypothetical protein IT374_00720 [Polyangiaceae bacterium]|nr:hypothetical protein [Polyangiaceae bacterium]